MAKKTIRNIDLSGKKTLVRVDFNVPLEAEGERMVITDDKRIRATLPTIKHLIQQKAKVILCSHLGRPKGKRDPKQSLEPVATRLAELLGQPVAFATDCAGPEAEAKVSALSPGGVVLLENLRFHAEEEKNDPDFAGKLASLAEAYVNDAFGSAHRAHASTEGAARKLPVAVAGFLMEKELQFLGGELENPKRPFVVILGGAKVSDKIKVIDALLEKADAILIGGAMAYTFAMAQGKKIGSSLCEPDKIETAKAALNKAVARNVRFLLPSDHIIVESMNFDAKTVSTPKCAPPGEDIPDGWQGVDIGPRTIEQYSAEVAKAALVVWNGPMGVFEISACSKGTFAIAKAVAANKSCVSIIGGGDSAKAVKKAGVANDVTFVSTGGGASLEFLEGNELPGVAALNEA